MSSVVFPASGATKKLLHSVPLSHFAVISAKLPAAPTPYIKASVATAIRGERPITVVLCASARAAYTRAAAAAGTSNALFSVSISVSGAAASGNNGIRLQRCSPVTSADPQEQQQEVHLSRPQQDRHFSCGKDVAVGGVQQ